MTVVKATVSALLCLTGETIQAAVVAGGLRWSKVTGVVATVNALLCTTGETIQALSIDETDPANPIVEWGLADDVVATVSAFLCTTGQTIRPSVDGVLQWETVWQESYLHIPPPPVTYLLDLPAYVPGVGLTMFYFATDGSGGSRMQRGIVYDGHYYEPRLKQPGNFQQQLFSDGTTSGPSQIGHGEIVLLNPDGGLDIFETYGLDGRVTVLRKLIAGVATILMSCSMEQPVPNWDTMPIRVKDKQMLLNVPIQPTKYSGNNSLPNGVEGSADIQGTPKPLAYGEVFNATPTCVNTSKLIYQAHESAVYDITVARDKGVPLTRGADYASQVEMLATAPSPGEYRVWRGGGMFRLGSSPVGLVTCDIVEGDTAADRTAAQIAKRMALRGISLAEISAADITALDVKNSAVIGIYINQETTISAALDEVLNSIGAWYIFNSEGILTMGRLEPPSETAVVTLTRSEVKSMERVATSDEGRGLPVYKVNLNYAKNFTVQEAGSLAGSISIRTAWESHFVNAFTKSAVAFGNGLFVIVGQDGGATSPDGVVWTRFTMPGSSRLWEHVAYGNGVFVASSLAGEMAVSADGITWTRHTAPAGGRGIAFGEGLFVTVDYGTTMATSPDGITWTSHPISASAEYWDTVVYGGGIFVAIAGGISPSDVAATSTDGITWTPQTLPSSKQWFAATYGNGLFAVVANYAATSIIITSSDGVNWTERNLPVSGYWSGIAYGDGLFIAVAGGSASTSAAISIDGITWTLETLPSVSNWRGLCYGNGMFVVATDGNFKCLLYRLSAAAQHRIFISKQYRTVIAVDPTVLIKHPTARELNINTLLVDIDDAQAEADRKLDMMKLDRGMWDITVPAKAMPPDTLGQTLGIILPRFQCDDGRSFVTLKTIEDYELETITAQVWG